MKSLYLVLLTSSFIGCAEEATKQQRNMISEKATIFYDVKAIDNCVIQLKQKVIIFMP